MCPDSQQSILYVVPNITPSFPANRGRIFLNIFFNDSGPLGHFFLKTGSSRLMIQTEKLKMISNWDITVEQIFHFPFPLPHKRSGLLTPFVGLAM